jgi:tRNA(Ile)-lysidine synthase TilS/MesJ
MKELTKVQEIERSLITTFRRRIYTPFTRAVTDFGLIRAGDRIAVCISGGKDSMTLAKCMQELKRHGIDNFEVVFLVMNPGYNASNMAKIEENLKILNIPAVIYDSDIFSVAEYKADKGSPCYVCARMRRGCLYAKAKELGCNKIALGHHFDDVIETTLMGMFYNGQAQTMIPKLSSEHFEGMELIRPLYYVRERDITAFTKANGLSFIRCACRRAERNGAEDEGKRAATKELIAELEKKDSRIPHNIFKSMYNVPSRCGSRL